MVLPPSRLAFGGPPTSRAAIPPRPLSPWQSAHLSAKILAPSAALPLPGGRLVPSGRMLMSHSARSLWLTGLPRFGVSAKAAPPPIASAKAQVALRRSRIDMPDLTLGIHAPPGDGVEVVAGKAERRRRPRSLSALVHELVAGRLHVAALVPRPALQDGRSAVPAPRHAKACKGLRQPRLVECCFAPALAAISGDDNFRNPPVAGISDAGNLIEARLLEREAR